jgi:hypothetical protein
MRSSLRCLSVALCVFAAYTLVLDWVFLHRPAGRSSGCPLPRFLPDEAFRRNVSADDLYDTKVGLGEEGHTYGAGDFVFNAPRFSFVVRADADVLSLRHRDELHLVDDTPLTFLHMHCNGSDKRTSPLYAISAGAVDTLRPAFAQPYTSPVALSHANASFTVDAWCTVSGMPMRNRNFVLRRDPYIAGSVRARRRRLGVQERFDHRAGAANARPLNVVVIIIDSLADAHFRRTMPLTMRFLERLERDDVSQVFRFDRYHVLGWHSDQNQPAIFAGAAAVAFPHILARMAGTVLLGGSRGAVPFQCDDLLWSRYAKLGYLTSEADCRCNIDDLLKYGRHLSQSHCGGRNITQIIDVTRPGHYFCGPLFDGYTDHRHKVCARDNIRMISDTIRAYGDLPVFATAYLEELHGARAGAFAAHVDPQMAGALDDARHMFNDSMVVFVSDHGLHFGAHLESMEGQIEHKLPLLHIAAPTWWLRRHPDAARALAENQHTLTQHYDLHATLEHLVRIDQAYYEAHRDETSAPSATTTATAAAAATTAKATRNDEALALAAYFASEGLPQRWPAQASTPSLLSRLSLGLLSSTVAVDELVPGTTMPPLEQQQSPVALSLFTVVPKARDCEAAAIPATLCVCADLWENVTTLPLNVAASVEDEERQLASSLRGFSTSWFWSLFGPDDKPTADDLQRLAVIAVAHINNRTRVAGSALRSAMPCGSQQLHSIHSASLKEWTKSGGSAGRLVRLLFRTAPTGAMYEADLWCRVFGAFVWATKLTGGVDVVRVTRVSGMLEADRQAFERYRALALAEANITVMGNALDSGLNALETTLCVDSASPDIAREDRSGPLTPFFVRHQGISSLERHAVELERPVLFPPRVVSFAGCFVDRMASTRLFQRFVGVGFTPQKCVERCAALRKAVAGIQLASECWCNDELPPASTKSSSVAECLPCPAAADACVQCERCGGSMRLAVYTRAPLPSADLSQLRSIGCMQLPSGAPVFANESSDRAHLAAFASLGAPPANKDGWSLVGVSGYIATLCAPLCRGSSAVAIGAHGACWCVRDVVRLPSGTADKCDAACAQPTTLPCGGEAKRVSVFEILQAF